MPNKLYSPVNPQNAAADGGQGNDDGREKAPLGTPQSIGSPALVINPNENAPSLPSVGGAE